MDVESANPAINTPRQVSITSATLPLLAIFPNLMLQIMK
jgi:hypothetical protein